MNLAHLALCLPLIVSPVSRAQSEREAEVRRAVEARQRMQKGDKLSAAENEFLKSLSESVKQRNAAFGKENPPRDSTGMVPLTELRKGYYKGEQGGIYPGGANEPPAAHRTAGLEIARRITPLDAEGKTTPDGKIVLLSIGMSNTTQSFQVFMKRAAADAEINPRAVIVDGAQGGNSAEVTADPKSGFWPVVDERLSKAGVTPAQVQVIWMKQAIQMPSRPFPVEARALHGYLLENAHILSRRFSNLKIVYLSSRIYGGFAQSALNPEPHAYESGFAVNWLIADQIAGKPELNYDPKKGAVRSAWLAWGPYLWADGIKARADGLAWLREDLAGDGTHPSMSGREKVAGLLLDFLKKDPSSRPWFVKK